MISDTLPHQGPGDSMVKPFALPLKTEPTETSGTSSSTALEGLPAASILLVEEKRTESAVDDQLKEEQEKANKEEEEEVWGMDPAEYARSRAPAAEEAKVSDISYITIDHEGVEEVHSVSATRSDVKTSLRCFYHLHAHLRASTTILNAYDPETFSSPALSPLPPSYNPLDTSSLAAHQITFTHHHNAVSETLSLLEANYTVHSFGLPDNSSFVLARNFFCHSLGRPSGGAYWAAQVGKLKVPHERLLRQVEATTALLEDHLAAENAWREKEELEYEEGKVHEGQEEYGEEEYGEEEE